MLGDPSLGVACLLVMTVVEGRRRLEKTLASPVLTDKESVYRLVHDRLAASYSDNESIDEKETTDHKGALSLAQSRYLKLWDLLELLRSASEIENQNDGFVHGEGASIEGWKLKEETGQMRSMYREGPKGTPFHTLLAEGLIYSPIVNALCLAWEAPAFKLWWPQLVLPTFKVIESRWVKRSFIGEDLSLIRLKVPWPFLTREVLMHAFELEYCDEDLIIVLLHSAPSDATTLEEVIPGLKPSDIPDVSPTIVRMDLAGGFALQRLTEEQSYFRTVVNLDMKLDFVPPWVINFISRQLVGLGFNLYQKTLTSVKNNEGKSQNLKKLIETEPLYNRITENFQSKKADMKARNEHNLLEESMRRRSAASNDANLVTSKVVGEIISHDLETVSSGHTTFNIVTDELAGKTSVLSSAEPLPLNANITLAEDRDTAGDGVDCEGLPVDSKVLKALQILDKAISFVQVHGSSPIKTSAPTSGTENSAGSSPNLVSSSADVNHDATKQVSSKVLVNTIPEHKSSISQSVFQRLAKVVPALQLMNAASEQTVNGLKSPDLQPKERAKPRRSSSCLRF